MNGNRTPSAAVVDSGGHHGSVASSVALLEKAQCSIDEAKVFWSAEMVGAAQLDEPGVGERVHQRTRWPGEILGAEDHEDRAA